MLFIFELHFEALFYYARKNALPGYLAVEGTKVPIFERSEALCIIRTSLGVIMLR